VVYKFCNSSATQSPYVDMRSEYMGGAECHL
jgi:hypothetical protein